jgi:predicted PurR-regulated permease PerM
MGTKERYWKNSLVVLILIMGIIIFIEFYPMLNGLLGAFTVYMLVRHQMFYFTEKRKKNKNLVAILLLVEVILCILIPTFFFVWIILSKLGTIEIEPYAWIESLQKYIDIVQQKTGYNLLSSDNLDSITSFVTKAIPKIIGEVSSFVISSVVLLLILYFMLTSARKMEAYVRGLLPFNDNNKRSILHSIHSLVVSNAIGVPLLAIIQGAVGVVGYLIFGAPSPILFGLMTCFATIIPVVGTAIVWLPLSLYVGFTSSWFMGIGLALFSLLILTNIDNAVRFILQKKMADTHPLITIFGVIIGLSLFGFWGVIFGPLLLSMFFLCIDIYKREYLESKPEETEIENDTIENKPSTSE